ncbi:centrosomal protein of 95 kDa-like isoform X2 [Takifugu flavidus]|uniref:centrosomal protein of 95 kDa-like isoform X2 n=1 Tax=Takifugu flavidus TaxID=433684 RepID=UPI0025444460|nr:centrosomal protein of 95 kDa-like isoform X2 [Takifugu flavidus]
MGTQEGERDWIDVANNLLRQCHTNPRVRKLTDCDADVFIALYENILGEKVPDYIAAAGSQEDDIHNVQSVIDSLSLDYLQISLSHITGENVIRGDKDSIKNLLEIFDGLLEYLKEETIEESQNDGIAAVRNSTATEEPEQSSSSIGESLVHASKLSLHSSNAEEQRSDGELLGLGVSARTFTAKQEDGVTTSRPTETHDGPQTESPLTAIALQAPNQSDGPPVGDRPSQGHTGECATERSQPPADVVVINGLQSPAATERSLPCQLKSRAEVEEETLEPTNGGPRRVLFHTQPDVLYLTLQDGRPATSLSPPDVEDDEDVCATNRHLDAQTHHKYKRSPRSRLPEDGVEGSLSDQRRKNKQAEKELHHISEKLSHRLEELDQMLKRVLVESGETGEDDQGSHHSGSLTECHGTPRQHADAESSRQTESSSPGSSRGPSSLPEQGNTSTLEGVRPTLLTASQHSRRDQHQRWSHRKHEHQQNRTYEESKRGQDEDQADVDEARLKAQEAERQYREAILRDVSQVNTPSRGRTTPQHTPPSSGRRRHEIRRPPSMKVNENELLPALLEELPHLHISPHSLGRMWEQQMQQAHRLRAAASPSSRRGGKLGSQLQEAQRKHDLLVEHLHKDQEHKRRLREFKERIQQQKMTQSRLREHRQQTARAKKYYDDYHVQHRARLMRMRTKEEKMFRQLFEESLELQKVRLREQRAYAREQRQEQQRRYQDHVTSMENYYKDQFSILAEKLAQERQEVQVRKKAQEKVLLRMKRELRSRMEHEIEELQKIISHNDEDNFIQDLEVQRLRNRMQMASFQFNTSYLQ